VAGLVPDADVAIVWSNPSKWLLEKYATLMGPDGGPDTRSYQGLVGPFYRGAFDAGLQVRLLHAGQLTGGGRPGVGIEPAEAAGRHPVLVATGLYGVEDEMLDWLLAYADAGGHLVLGPRTGYGDHEGRARAESAPARLREAAGVRYDEFCNLLTGVPVTSTTVALPAGAGAARWLDGLEVTDAEVLARYDHPHFGQWPALTTKTHGRGRITTVGALPDQHLAQALMRWLVPEPVNGWRELPPSVTATTGTAPDGGRIHVVHNWSFDPVMVHTPGPLEDVLGGSATIDSHLALGPWDVRVLAEPCPATTATTTTATTTTATTTTATTTTATDDEPRTS
jgi:beta-galactosidase